MCTAITYRTRDFYFGRNLDYERSFGECVAVTPRKFRIPLRAGGVCETRYAMIGMASVRDGFPLYYDAVNEAGLCIAGLNFVGNAVYRAPQEACTNWAQFELIPALLGQCGSVQEARPLLTRLCITDASFVPGLPVAQLHWLIADREACIVLESTADGVHVYENPAGVLTNNPPFPIQQFALNNYMQLSPQAPTHQFGGHVPMTEYSRGMGALGLPGDGSSQSRFVRAAFLCANGVSGAGESESVGQFFHMLDGVAQVRGTCQLADGSQEYTLYACCCNASRGIYYYTTYTNRQITAVDLHRAPTDAAHVTCYPLRTTEAICMENESGALSPDRSL